MEPFIGWSPVAQRHTSRMGSSNVSLQWELETLCWGWSSGPERSDQVKTRSSEKAESSDLEQKRCALAEREHTTPLGQMKYGRASLYIKVRMSSWLAKQQKNNVSSNVYIEKRDASLLLTFHIIEAYEGPQVILKRIKDVEIVTTMRLKEDRIVHVMQSQEKETQTTRRARDKANFSKNFIKNLSATEPKLFPQPHRHLE